MILVSEGHKKLSGGLVDTESAAVLQRLAGLARMTVSATSDSWVLVDHERDGQEVQSPAKATTGERLRQAGTGTGRERETERHTHTDRGRGRERERERQTVGYTLS